MQTRARRGFASRSARQEEGEWGGLIGEKLINVLEVNLEMQSDTAIRPGASCVGNNSGEANVGATG